MSSADRIREWLRMAEETYERAQARGNLSERTRKIHERNIARIRAALAAVEGRERPKPVRESTRRLEVYRTLYEHTTHIASRAVFVRSSIILLCTDKKKREELEVKLANTNFEYSQSLEAFQGALDAANTAILDNQPLVDIEQLVETVNTRRAAFDAMETRVFRDIQETCGDGIQGAQPVPVLKDARFLTRIVNVCPKTKRPISAAAVAWAKTKEETVFNKRLYCRAEITGVEGAPTTPTEFSLDTELANGYRIAYLDATVIGVAQKPPEKSLARMIGETTVSLIGTIGLGILSGASMVGEALAEPIAVAEPVAIAAPQPIYDSVPTFAPVPAPIVEELVEDEAQVTSDDPGEALVAAAASSLPNREMQRILQDWRAAKASKRIDRSESVQFQRAVGAGFEDAVRDLQRGFSKSYIDA